MTEEELESFLQTFLGEWPWSVGSAEIINKAGDIRMSLHNDSCNESYTLTIVKQL